MMSFYFAVILSGMYLMDVAVFPSLFGLLTLTYLGANVEVFFMAKAVSYIRRRLKRA